MITAVDTSVFLDVFADDPRHAVRSKEWLRVAYDRGAIVACDIVYAELAPAFPDQPSLDHALRMLGATVSPITTDVSYVAGRRWLRYRQAGGSRKRIITDFLIGAHALSMADVFLTRDRGFFGTYFQELGRPTPEP